MYSVRKPQPRYDQNLHQFQRRWLPRKTRFPQSVPFICPFIQNTFINEHKLWTRPSVKLWDAKRSKIKSLSSNPSKSNGSIFLESKLVMIVVIVVSTWVPSSCQALCQGGYIYYFIQFSQHFVVSTASSLWRAVYRFAWASRDGQTLPPSPS